MISICHYFMFKKLLLGASFCLIANTFAAGEFIMTWKTNYNQFDTNTSVTIPTFPGEDYLYDVDWDNDGIFDDIGVTGDITHDY
jgi:hypothetical protein